MEIIIAMTIGVILGAYIRQPFPLRRQVIGKSAQDTNLTERERKEQQKLFEQYNNMMSYSGKEQK